MKHMLFFIVFLFMEPGIAGAQAINNHGIERSINQSDYFRLNYANDYFTATDYYFTQGIFLELVHPHFQKSPLSRLLYSPGKLEHQYGMAIEHDAYTPVSIERPEVQYGDRPFAGSLFLKMFVRSTDTLRKRRISTTLSTGIVGQGAGAKQMQVFIHKHTQNVIPKGWDNQIRNDIIVNYEVSCQQQLVAWENYLTLTADVMGRLGTLSTKASLGFTLMAGYYNTPFASLNIKGRKIQFFAYDHPELSLVGYDATLEGGLFNRNSPYTVTSGAISRIVFRNNWGLVLQAGRFYLEYYQYFITKEFRGGMDFRNGGIQLAYSF